MIPTTYEAAFDGGQIITDEFIHDTEGVFMLRYMDSMDTNNSVAFTKTDYDRTYPYPQELVRITMRSVAEISNATGTTPWICIPTYGTDQLVTDLLTELSTYYTGSVAVEYGNEIWNSGFKNSFEWVSLGDVTHVDSGAVTSGVVNVTTHGFNTGDQLNMFNGISGTSFPYALGAPHWVLKIDNDNFGTAHVGYGDTSTNGQYTQGRWAISDVQNLNPCVVTAVGHNFNTGNKIRIEGTGISQLDGNDYIVTVSGDDFSLDGVDATAYDAYAPPSNDYAYRFRTYTRSNGIRYKSREAGVIWNNRHYSERASEIWAVADAVIGRDKCIHIIGTQGASGGGFNASQILAWQPTKENIDYLSIAPYWQVSGAMLDTMTTAEITDQLINGSRTRDFDNILSWFTNHVSVMDCYRVITYEGNDESGFTVQNNVSRYNALRAWMASDDGVAAYDYFYKALADRGCLSHTQYKLTYWNTIPNSGSSYYTWGINDVSGEESPRWVKLNEFAAAGGAPKN